MIPLLIFLNHFFTLMFYFYARQVRQSLQSLICTKGHFGYFCTRVHFCTKTLLQGLKKNFCFCELKFLFNFSTLLPLTLTFGWYFFLFIIYILIFLISGFFLINKFCYVGIYFFFTVTPYPLSVTFFCFFISLFFFFFSSF